MRKTDRFGSDSKCGEISYNGPQKSITNCRDGWRTSFSYSSLCFRNHSRRLFRFSRLRKSNNSGGKYRISSILFWTVSMLRNDDRSGATASLSSFACTLAFLAYRIRRRASKLAIARSIDAATQTWQEQLGSIGYRARLHGTEFRTWSGGRQANRYHADPRRRRARRHILRHRRNLRAIHE